MYNTIKQSLSNSVKVASLCFLMVFAVSCSSNDDDDQSTNLLIGTYDIASFGCTFNNGSSSGGGGTIEIIQSTSGVPNEVALKGFFGNANVHNAVVSGNTFTLSGNSNGETGSGTLQNDGVTLQYTVNDPNNSNDPGLVCTGVAEKQ